VHITDQLQRAVEVNEYAEAARLLEAVQQLSAHFHSFVSIPKVAELGGRVSMLQRALQVLPPGPNSCLAAATLELRRSNCFGAMRLCSALPDEHCRA